MKFNDLNANGSWDTGEPGIEDWAIYLKELDGTLVEKVYTDVNGDYLFDDIKPGTYRIYEEDRDGWTQSLPGSVYYQEIFTSGEDKIDNDFGNWQPATKTGMKFNDLNANGSWDTGEPGIEDWAIYLKELDGTLVEKVYTDVNGDYLFDDIKPGTYRIYEEDRDGWMQSLPGSVYYQETFTSGEDKIDNDFGNWQYATKSGYKYRDLNENGQRDIGEPGLADWTIYIDANDNGQMDGGERSTATSSTGYYEFNNLVPGTYVFREVMQTDWRQTEPASGYYRETLVSGEQSTNNNFGNVFYSEETAWAYGPGYANPNWDFTDSENWGWNNGGLPLPTVVGTTYTYEFELHAGAGGNVRTSETLVGAVYAYVYAEGGDMYSVTFSFVMFGDNELGDTHLWVGITNLPMKPGGSYTDAPGQLKYVEGTPVLVTGREELYIAVHAIVRMYGN
jgi:hypothetical protein